MRAKKEGEFVNVKVRRDIADRLNDYIQKTAHTKTATIEHALTTYFDMFDARRGCVQTGDDHD